MEFPFNLEKFLPTGSNGVVVFPKSCPDLGGVLDAMGAESAKAQALLSPITTFEKLVNSQDRVYILIDRHKCLGYIKVGTRKLFLHNSHQQQMEKQRDSKWRKNKATTISRGSCLREYQPLCVLDFFVYESCRRSGKGKQLFDAMCKAEEIEAEKLAFDRPSNLSLRFLDKHFGLGEPLFQNNHFVVFEPFFVSDSSSYKLP